MSAITSLPSGVGGGALNLISTQTASSSSTIDFTSGIDSTYKEYIFKFINIHPATDQSDFTFQVDTGTNTSYNQTVTNTYFQAYHNESGSASSLDYLSSYDQAQGTSFIDISHYLGNQNDECCSGTLHLFDPSNTTFVKHFICRINSTNGNEYTSDYYSAGYFNTTTALTRVRFKMASGNIDSGTIKLYGVS
jgi:hypothetical protein